MSHESIIFAKLKGLVSNRCFPDSFPQEPEKPVWPAIRYTQVGGDIEEDVCGSGDAETDSSLFQIDIVTHTATSRATLKEQVRAAMKTLEIPNALTQAPIHTFDVETKTYRCIMLYTVYGSSL